MMEIELTETQIMINTMKKLLCCARYIANGIGRDLALIAVRVSMIFIFFSSGMRKIEDWDTTLFLFEAEYAIPYIPYELAAYLATFFELAMPVLIVVGLGTRLSCLPLLAIAGVIQFVLGGVNPAYNQLSHYWWMLLLVVLITHGAGRISLDWLFCRIFCKGKNTSSANEGAD